MTLEATGTDWQKTACILCSLNCGLEVQVGGPDGRHLAKIKGDTRPSGLARILLREGAAPRLLPDGRRSARRAAAAARRTAASSRSTGTPRSARSPRSSADIKARYGGDKILYYGGGGQGNHLGGSYGAATLAAIGNRYRSNALAQEKTGEFWVNGKHDRRRHARRLRALRGRGLHRQEPLAVARLRARPRDHRARWRRIRSARSSSSIRGAARRRRRRTSTSRSSPGTDAWCLAALVAIIVQEDLVRRDWVAEHTTRLRGRRAAVPGDRRRRVRRRVRRRRGAPAPRRAAHRRRPRACRCTRISGCRCRCTRRSAAGCSGSSGSSPATSAARAPTTRRCRSSR